jgi:DMSO/TMAO reductase YedYZ heme-binding membrane subunit
MKNKFLNYFGASLFLCCFIPYLWIVYSYIYQNFGFEATLFAFGSFMATVPLAPFAFLFFLGNPVPLILGVGAFTGYLLFEMY